MELLKLLLVFVLSFEAISAAARSNGKRNSFSVEKTWQSHKKKGNSCSCKRKEEEKQWKGGVQECYDGVNTASLQFHDEAYDLADATINSLEEYLSKIIYLSSTDSTVLAPSSEAILGLFAKCNKLNQSADNIMVEYGKVLPEIMEGFKGVATKLSDYLGDVTVSFNENLDELGCVLSKFLGEFHSKGRLNKKNVDYEPTLKKHQKLMNTVALIAEKTLSNFEVEPEVQEAVTVLSLIFWCLSIVVQGMNICATQVLLENQCDISQTTTSISISFDYVLVSITQAAAAIVFPLNQSIKDFLTIFVNLTVAKEDVAFVVS